jgi:acetoin utilization protein AcuB
MTRNPLTISPDSPAAQAAQMMRDHKFGSLPVVEQDRVVGIVTVSDILDSYIDLMATAGAQAL